MFIDDLRNCVTIYLRSASQTASCMRIQYASKRMHQLYKLYTTFVPLFDKKRGCFVPHFYVLPLICAGNGRIKYCSVFFAPFPLRLQTLRTFTGHQAFALQNGVAVQKAPQSFDCDTFCHLGFEHAALSPGVRLLHHKMALKGALSGIVAHLQRRRCTSTEYGTLARKDTTLSQ